MKYDFSLRCIVVLCPPKGKRATLPGMAERKKGLCVPSTIVVLMFESSREDCCSEEIKAVASPRAVHLH